MSSDYLADVQRYDWHADSDTVQRIVRHLGVALRTRDAALVACGDQTERVSVRQTWCMAKLGADDISRCDEAIARICEAMAGDGSKQRVTFYYLVARELGKLDAI